MAGLAGEPDNGLADAIEAANTMLDEGEFDDAIETFTAILEEEPENAVRSGNVDLMASYAIERLPKAALRAA